MINNPLWWQYFFSSLHVRNVGEKPLEEGMKVKCFTKTEKETTSIYKIYSINCQEITFSKVSVLGRVRLDL
jgi:hypothetical protein